MIVNNCPQGTKVISGCKLSLQIELYGAWVFSYPRQEYYIDMNNKYLTSWRLKYESRKNRKIYSQVT